MSSATRRKWHRLSASREGGFKDCVRGRGEAVSPRRCCLQREPHAYARHEIVEPTLGFFPSHRAKFWTDLVILQYREAEVCVQRRVNVREGRQRDCGSAGVLRPGSCLIDETSADAHSLVLGFDAHLLDVCVPVDIIDQQKSDRPVIVIERDPTTTGVRVPDECLDRPRFVIGNVVDPTERFASTTLDLTQR